MNLTIAAIRSGTDPSGPLPPGAFHRTLDTQLTCPKCDVTYNLIADYEQSTGRFFEESARPLLLMLSKAVFLGHGNDHHVSHFETSGVIVRAVTPAPVATKPAQTERGKPYRL
jgi:hypothetical protein